MRPLPDLSRTLNDAALDLLHGTKTITCSGGPIPVFVQDGSVKPLLTVRVTESEPVRRTDWDGESVTPMPIFVYEYREHVGPGDRVTPYYEYVGKENA